MTDRLDALIAMVAQNIQTDNDETVDQINRIGRARAEYLLDFIRRLDGLRNVAADELKRVQHFLPAPSQPTQRIAPVKG